MNKFHVGEKITLVSTALPQYNGEYTILAVIPPKSCYKGCVSNCKVWCYDLGFTVPESNTPNFTAWKEHTIKKRPKPSTESYSELLISLNGVVKCPD